MDWLSFRTRTNILQEKKKKSVSLVWFKRGGVKGKERERENTGGIESDEHQYINSCYICPDFQRAVCLRRIEHVRKVKVNNEKGAFVQDVNLKAPGECCGNLIGELRTRLLCKHCSLYLGCAVFALDAQRDGGVCGSVFDTE